MADSPPGAQRTTPYYSQPHTSLDVPAELTSHPNFQVSKELGRGGMGVVYQAVDRSLDRLVAIKVIHPTLVSQPDALARFDQEARTAARLSHPNIVQTYAKETAGNLFLLVMEFVDGIDLETYVQQKGLPEPHLACHFVRQAALALQHGLEKGVVHRDIKPNNLMITRKGQLKVMDFGLAKLGNRAGPAEHGLTSATAIMGTADYMAPEQAVSSKDADVRADLYSLGCTLFFLLTGKPPFHRATPLETIVAHQRDTVPEIRDVLPDIPPGVAEIVRKLLQKDPADRYQRPAELAQALAVWARKDSWGSAWNTLVNLDRIQLARIQPSPPLLRQAEVVQMHTPHQPSMYPMVTRPAQPLAPPARPRPFKRKKSPSSRPSWLKWVGVGGAALFLVVVGAILSRALNPAAPQAEDSSPVPRLGAVVPTVPLPTRPAEPVVPGNKNDYDTFATGRWRHILEEGDALGNAVGIRRVGDSLITDNERGGSLHIARSTARNSILRAKVKKISGQHLAMTLRLSGTDAARDVRAFAVWFNGGNHFGIARFENSSYTELAQFYSPARLDDFFELAFAAIDDKIMVFVDGKKLHEEIDKDPCSGVARLTTLKSHSVFQDIEFMSLDDSSTLPPRQLAAYDGLATGSWRRVLERNDDMEKVKGMRREGNALATDARDVSVVTIRDSVCRDSLVRARIRKISGQHVGLALRSTDDEGIAGTRRGLRVAFHDGNHFTIGVGRADVWRGLADFRTDERYDDHFFELAVAAIGPRIIVFVDGKKVQEATDPNPVPGAAVVGAIKANALIKDVDFMPLER